MKKLTILVVLIVVLLNAAIAFAGDGTQGRHNPAPTRTSAQTIHLMDDLTLGGGGRQEGPGPGGGDVSEDDLNAACPKGWIVTYDEDANGDPIQGSQNYACTDD
ncbi:MAG: hypothetical protein H7175_19615 [Burkholderiales bacterium]|nr:hypothetical protein [Anaerolineae bacterium]